jgi:sterol desaturase/sphingolipid hydroxylase (fatty acid hydroxylase superfamily)
MVQSGRGIEKYFEIFFGSFAQYWNYLKQEVLVSYAYKPWYENYFYWLILVSLLVWAMEIFFPWRKNQKIIRKDFWLDGFYMFFNFFIFNLIAFIALSNTFEQIFKDLFGIQNLQIVNISSLGKPLQLILFFVITDFNQWGTHRMLHRVPFLWEFHKVHHSVREMGFAAHLRYHWMETVVYKSMLYLPVAVLGGFDVEDVFIVHFLAILIGHMNHANIHVTYGPLRYIFNNPVMHLWHHAMALPEKHKFGVNFGISLSLWDYIFKTNYIPKDDGEIELGFPGVSKFPKRFFGQIFHGFSKPKD